jgi:hypothetical protein
MWSTERRHSARSWVEPDAVINRSDPARADSPFLPSAEPDIRQDPIAAAMSWLMACIIEGFAAVAYAHYPYPTGQADRIAVPDWEQHARPVRDTERVTDLGSSPATRGFKNP